MHQRGQSLLKVERRIARSSVVERRFQFLEVELFHLPHLGHHGFLLRFVLGGIPLVEVRRGDLPADTELVDQPAAFHGLAATGR